MIALILSFISIVYTFATLSSSSKIVVVSVTLSAISLLGISVVAILRFVCKICLKLDPNHVMVISMAVTTAVIASYFKN